MRRFVEQDFHHIAFKADHVPFWKRVADRANQCLDQWEKDEKDGDVDDKVSGMQQVAPLVQRESGPEVRGLQEKGTTGEGSTHT